MKKKTVNIIHDELLSVPSKKEIHFFEAINKEMSHKITTVNLGNNQNFNISILGDSKKGDK